MEKKGFAQVKPKDIADRSDSQAPLRHTAEVVTAAPFQA
jgi:hypothetical protein